MNNYADQFRKEAEECRQLASLARKADDRAFWPRFAEEWTNLVEVLVMADGPRQNENGWP
jgi:hypothetical protein